VRGSRPCPSAADSTSDRPRVDATECSDLQGVLEARTLAEVTGVLADVEEATRRGWTAAGFVAYDAAPAFDPALTVAPGGIPAPGPGLPLAWFGLFATTRSVAPVPRVAPPGAAPGWQGPVPAPHARMGPPARPTGRLDL